MTNIEDLVRKEFVCLFNEGVPNTIEPKEEEPISFNVINGEYIVSYKSTNSEKQMRTLALDKISRTQITKQMRIIEPAGILYDYDFCVKNICSIFKSDKDRIQLKQMNLINRAGNVSTYSITADVYPEIYSVLKEPFSLEKLYYAFVGATVEEKKIIVDYLNSLKFIRFDSISYINARKNSNQEELKLLSLDEMYKEKLKKVLDEATRNSNIIGLFNLDNPLLEIVTPVRNEYTDDVMSYKKLSEEKDAKQLQKKLDNFSKYLEDDIDE